MSAGTAAILDFAADLCGRGWTQGTLARHENGNPIGPREDNAACWCAADAISAGSEMPGRILGWDALSRVIGEDIVYWNDAPGRTQAEVVAALREAARREREAT